MQLTFKTDDGSIELLHLDRSLNVATIKSGVPRAGTACTFKLSNLITEPPEIPQSAELAPSTYLSQTQPISAVIGITSTSHFDRLLDICLTKLHVSEKGNFHVQSNRNNASYTFSLELVEIQESFELFNLSQDRLQTFAGSLKDAGVLLFSSGFTIDAFLKFSEAFKYSNLNHPRTRTLAQVSFISTLYSNMSSCHVKLGNWNAAIDLCNLVLETDATNLKALYRRGSAYIELQEYEKAEQDLEKAKNLDPENSAVKNKINLLEDRKKVLNAKVAVGMKKYFS